MSTNHAGVFGVALLCAALMASAGALASDDVDELTHVDDMDLLESFGQARAETTPAFDPFAEQADPLSGDRRGFDFDFGLGDVTAFAGAGVGHELLERAEPTAAAGPDVGLRFQPRENVTVFGRMDYQFLYDHNISTGFDTLTERADRVYSVGVQFKF